MDKNTEVEICVMCDKKLDIPKSSHVSQRAHYIEGAGQLCDECFTNIYKPNLSMK